MTRFAQSFDSQRYAEKSIIASISCQAYLAALITKELDLQLNHPGRNSKER